jgi:hypothetical protein
MSEVKGRAIGGAPPASSALLLCGEQTTAEDRDLTRLLDFFAIPWKGVRTRDCYVDDALGPYSIVSSVDCMAEVLRDTQGLGGTLITRASTVYVYGFQDNDRSTKLLRLLTGDPQAKVRPINNSETIATVTGDHPEMCGPMSGMRIPITLRAPGCVCDIQSGVNAFQCIVRTDEGDIFFGVTCAGVRFYLNASGRTLDIGALSADYFDVKKFFCEAVPIVCYLKWAFRNRASSWREINACLIVDDPPLKRRYGFLDFREALNLMDRHNFTTTIAFIPWNWRRTHPSTLSLFQNHPGRFSLVVHGCDHTAGELAVQSPVLLNRIIQTSGQRMDQLQRRASVKADRVMIFPQGRFSAETGRALKLNGFIAAVNTEVAPAQKATNKTTIADLWSIAIMRYGTFPIFTRRYLGHGVENFAFDALLGKPCFIAAHHDVFRDRARNLIDFVERLNSLRWNLVWRPLGEAIRHSYATRYPDDGTSVIHMFASSLIVENTDAEARKALILKEEADADWLQAVRVNEAPVEYGVQDGYLRICLTMPPGETATVRLVYRNAPEALPDRNGSGAKIKVAAQRSLSEFRDNYLSRSDFLYQSAYRLKHIIK